MAKRRTASHLRKYRITKADADRCKHIKGKARLRCIVEQVKRRIKNG